MRPVIRPRHRGPFVIEGDVEIRDFDGNVIDTAGRSRILLCRCGHSKSRPLCDGSHNRVAFEDEPQ